MVWLILSLIFFLFLCPVLFHCLSSVVLILVIIISLRGYGGYVMAKSVFTCFQILKHTMNKWAQYPAQMEA